MNAHYILDKTNVYTKLLVISLVVVYYYNMQIAITLKNPTRLRLSLILSYRAQANNVL